MTHETIVWLVKNILPYAAMGGLCLWCAVSSFRAQRNRWPRL